MSDYVFHLKLHNSILILIRYIQMSWKSDKKTPQCVPYLLCSYMYIMELDTTGNIMTQFYDNQ
jgi:hypothetical protein